MTTKQEERQILAQIEALIASAGDDSYIAIAFSGCCKIARENIENDFGNSLESSLATCRHSLDAEKEARRLLEKDNALLENALRQKNTEISQLRDQISAERSKQLPDALYKDLWLCVDGQRERAAKQMADITEMLATMADAPQDIAVAGGLKRLHAERLLRDSAARLLHNLQQYAPDGC